MAEDFDDDLVSGISLWIKPRFLLADQYFGGGELQSGLGRYDILQEARAPKAMKHGKEWVSIVIRWETSFCYYASEVSSLDGRRGRVFRAEPQPTLRFVVATESASRERRIIVPPTTAEATLKFSGDREENYSASGRVHSFLAPQVVESSAVVFQDRRVYSAEMSPIVVGLRIWNGRINKDHIRTQPEDNPNGLIHRLLKHYLENGKYPEIARGMLDPASGQPTQGVYSWPVSDGEPFVEVDVVYYVRADDRIGVTRRGSLPGWCVYVPRGSRKLLDMEVSPPVIRRTCTYHPDMDNKRLKPLLEVDSIDPWKLTWGTAESDIISSN